MARDDVWILHPDWLRWCRWSLAKAEEKTFLLIPWPIGKKYPTPKLSDSPLPPEWSKVKGLGLGLGLRSENTDPTSWMNEEGVGGKIIKVFYRMEGVVALLVLVIKMLQMRIERPGKLSQSYKPSVLEYYR